MSKFAPFSDWNGPNGYYAASEGPRAVKLGNVFSNSDNGANWVISSPVITPSKTGGPSIGGPPDGGAPPEQSDNPVNSVPLYTVLVSVGVLMVVAIIIGIILTIRSRRMRRANEGLTTGAFSQDYSEKSKMAKNTRQNNNTLASIKIMDTNIEDLGSPIAPIPNSPLESHVRISNLVKKPSSSDDSPAVARTLSNQSPTNHAEAPNALYTPYEAHPNPKNEMVQDQFEKWLASPTPTTKTMSLASDLESAHITDENDIVVIVADDMAAPEKIVPSQGLNKRTLNGVLI